LSKGLPFTKGLLILENWIKAYVEELNMKEPETINKFETINKG